MTIGLFKQLKPEEAQDLKSAGICCVTLVSEASAKLTGIPIKSPDAGDVGFLEFIARRGMTREDQKPEDIAGYVILEGERKAAYLTEQKVPSDKKFLVAEFYLKPEVKP